MPYKDLKTRKEYYLKNKDEINRKRREYEKNNPKVCVRKRLHHKKWREINKKEYNSRCRITSKLYRMMIREKVLKHYGNKCSCCGEKNVKFLTIDHINGNGNQHRKEIKTHLDRWLVKNNFPKGFQILCYNCNCGKRVNGGICPHKDNLKS